MIGEIEVLSLITGHLFPSIIFQMVGFSMILGIALNFIKTNVVNR